VTSNIDKAVQESLQSEPTPVDGVQWAVDRMFQDYEELIADPAAHLDKWAEYGTYDACRLCDAVSRLPGADKNPYYKHSCQAHCPLGPTNIMELKKCKKWPSCAAPGSFFDDMVGAIQDRDIEAIKTVAPKRLAWLKARIEGAADAHR